MSSQKEAVALGLKTEEYDQIIELIQRTPSFTELCIFSAMWNEHCSYKSSRVWLKTLPVTGECVIFGPGENAGVVDIGDGLAAVFKMESHNHPSFIEPFQGAATGVGGILRDVFTMGAKPVATVNALFFGDPNHALTPGFIRGVSHGISHYGNCFGVPMIAGSVQFDNHYNDNILVNAMAVGIAPHDGLFTAKAKGVDNLIIYVGARTGRDGIHGASMASAEFQKEEQEDCKRPTVQVGDPLTGKLLMEACLEVMDKKLVVAIQDMGAAGLTCSAVEMGAKGDLGIELNLDTIPCREDNMQPWEMMLSESQERMLMVVTPEKLAELEAVFAHWELPCAVIGKTTNSLRLIVQHQNQIVADLPIKQLGDCAPCYERPYQLPVTPTSKDEGLDGITVTDDLSSSLYQLLSSPTLASRQWIWQQYDYLVQGKTLQRPGGNAGIIAVKDTKRALAVTTDITPRYTHIDPKAGAMQAVIETWRNLTAVGAKPLAITNNLNFGNPEKPQIMGQFVAAIQGINTACQELEFPVVSGNVSLYNETAGNSIIPTPTIGAIGLLKNKNNQASINFKRAGDIIVLIGNNDKNHGWLGASVWLEHLYGKSAGAIPEIDIAAEKKHGNWVRSLIENGILDSVHDCSDGGLLITLAEMAMAGGVGCILEFPQHLSTMSPLIDIHRWFFGETQGRYVLALPSSSYRDVLQSAHDAAIPCQTIGIVGGDRLILPDILDCPVWELQKKHQEWLPSYMEGS